jgi:WhiB family redox-sensing transcriptional regulator
VTQHILVDRGSLDTELPAPDHGDDNIIDIRSLLAGLAGEHTDRDASDLDWQDDALCAQSDPDAFFPEKGGSTREAKAICARCPAKDDCLQFALDNDERFGVWGGLSERERRRLQRGLDVDDVDEDMARLAEALVDEPTAPITADAQRRVG